MEHFLLYMYYMYLSFVPCHAVECMQDTLFLDFTPQSAISNLHFVNTKFLIKCWFLEEGLTLFLENFIIFWTGS